MFEKKKEKRPAKKIVSVQIVSDFSEGKGRSVGGAIIGGALFGTVGAIAGSGKGQKSMTRFLIEYEGGSKQFIDVKTGSLLYTMWFNKMNQLSK